MLPHCARQHTHYVSKLVYGICIGVQHSLEESVAIRSHLKKIFLRKENNTFLGFGGYGFLHNAPQKNIPKVGVKENVFSCHTLEEPVASSMCKNSHGKRL